MRREAAPGAFKFQMVLNSQEISEGVEVVNRVVDHPLWRLQGQEHNGATLHKASSRSQVSPEVAPPTSLLQTAPCAPHLEIWGR